MSSQSQDPVSHNLFHSSVYIRVSIQTFFFSSLKDVEFGSVFFVWVDFQVKISTVRVHVPFCGNRLNKRVYLK